eukprot:350554-Chlamydomonas_euryale.AAC.8
MHLSFLQKDSLKVDVHAGNRAGPCFQSPAWDQQGRPAWVKYRKLCHRTRIPEPGAGWKARQRYDNWS